MKINRFPSQTKVFKPILIPRFLRGSGRESAPICPACDKRHLTIFAEKWTLKEEKRIYGT